MEKLKVLPIRPFPLLERYKNFRSEKHRAFYYRLLNNDLAYRWVNRDYRRKYRQLERPKADALSKRVVDDMKINGIAFARLDEFFDLDFFDQIHSEFDACKRAFKRRNDLGGKTVFLDTIQKGYVLNGDDATSRFLAKPEFASIAAAYLGMVPRFVGSSFWHTRQAPASERQYSQLWHRDYNDRQLVKIFLYLTDVGSENGYFEYMAGSHGYGRYGSKFDRIGDNGYRAYPEQAAVLKIADSLPVFETATLSPTQWSGGSAPWHGEPGIVRCTAPAGMLIFADTFGLHRGGYVESGFRDVVMTTFSTNFNIHKPHFGVTKQFAKRLSPFMRTVFGVA